MFIENIMLIHRQNYTICVVKSFFFFVFFFSKKFFFLAPYLFAPPTTGWIQLQ